MTSSLLTQSSQDYAALALSCLRPPPAQELWDWCSTNLVMPNGSRWDPRRAGLMRHFYRLVGARLSLKPIARDPYAHRCEQLYLVIAAQLAKTVLAHSVLLASIANHPRTCALYMARKDDVSNARDRKLRRQIEGTPALERLLPRGTEARERALGSRSWAIGSALVNFRIGSVADDLRADALELMTLDEFDTYPANVEGYGDPIDQALARQRTFPKSRLLIGPSTPGVVQGHAWRRLCSGSHERLLVDCPDCGAAQDLDPARVCLPDGRQLVDVSPAEITAARLGRFACKVCGSMWNGAQLHHAVRTVIEADRLWCPGTWQHDEQHPQGRWLAYANLDSAGRLKSIPPSESTIRSGQASALYSLDETLDSFAARMALAKQGSQSQQQTFTNNECAEPYIHIVTVADADDLTAAAQPTEPYQIGLLARPADYKLFLMFDQQGNQRSQYWFPWVLRAIEPGVGSWLVDEGIAKSDDEADALEERTWQVGGVHRRPDRVGRDSGNGNYLFDAYLWASRKPSLRILLRGDPRLADGVPYQEVVDNPTTRRRTPKPSGVREYRIAPHWWRDQLWNQVRGMEPVKWYLPSDASARYKASLTSEEQVVERRRVAGGWKDVVVWRPRVVTSTADRHTVREDNHWWDAETSVLAATKILGWDEPIVLLDLPPASAGGGFMDGFT